MQAKRTLSDEIIATLEQNTRGVQIGIYTLAGLGLAVAIHKVRPISKFSRALDVPDHFIRSGEVLRGRVVGCEPSSSGPRLLVDHRPPLRLPLWHSSKPPLPVQVWGVKLAGGNGVSWLQCVAGGQEVKFIPLGRTEDALLANVTLELPVVPPITKHKLDNKTKPSKSKLPQLEEIKVGERLVELGLGYVNAETAVKPKPDKRYYWMGLVRPNGGQADALWKAQSRAESRREGLWRDKERPSRLAAITPYLQSLLPPYKTTKKAATPSVL